MRAPQPCYGDLPAASNSRLHSAPEDEFGLVDLANIVSTTHTCKGFLHEPASPLELYPFLKGQPAICSTVSGKCRFVALAHDNPQMHSHSQLLARVSSGRVSGQWPMPTGS